MAFNNAAVNPLGGGKIVLSEVTLSAGVWGLVTPVANVTGLDLGRVNLHSFSTNTTEEILKDAHLDIVYTRLDKTPSTEATLMEATKIQQDFLEFLTIGKFYLEYVYEDIRGAKYQERFSVGQVVAQNNNSFPSGATSRNYKFNKLTVEVDNIFSSANLLAMEVAYGVTIQTGSIMTILAGRYHTLVETAVP